jgi:hypothetical protein
MAEPVDPSSYQQGEQQTLQAVLDALERLGFTGQFGVRSGSLRCFACGHDFAPRDAVVAELRRLEGASDPDDMLAVLALTCPECGTRGTLVLTYGPEASREHSEVLAALPQPERRAGDA